MEKDKKTGAVEPLTLSRKTRKKLSVRTDLRAGRPGQTQGPGTGTATSCNGWCTNSSGYCCTY
jgi:hypothetical protein